MVMRPASQRLNSRLPIVEMADAAGSSASAMAVASSISAGPSVGASGIFGSSLLTNVCSMSRSAVRSVSTSPPSRNSVSVEKRPARIAATMIEAPGRIPLDDAVARSGG